ncbi:AsnC family transcriptional regulator [Pseudomonas savastanoi pv. phaseolicola]|uniref:AsnC family transcriptional regulator n=1 Tax=Pseudomonas savastanoi pv. phaseolicola TaxID=319 RepID=A0ABD4BA41_PSESH|nr:AsnC family transcriptional regulator [Pseudomonas savastanoi pv. phaseolicola]
MDKFDRAILDILQTDCTRSVADIAERIGLGSTACWRRIQKLEEAGIIDRRVALLERVGQRLCSHPHQPAQRRLA